MRTKRSQSVFRVLYAFGTEASSRRNWKLGRMKREWWTFIFAKFLNNGLKKSWQNRLRACFECSVPSVQKPLFTGTWSFEACKWTDQHLLLRDFRIMVSRNADKTVPKCASSARAFGTETTFRRNFIISIRQSIPVNGCFICDFASVWVSQ